MKKCCWTCANLMSADSISVEPYGRGTAESGLEINVICDSGNGAKIEVCCPFEFNCYSYERNPDLEEKNKVEYQ